MLTVEKYYLKVLIKSINLSNCEELHTTTLDKLIDRYSILNIKKSYN